MADLSLALSRLRLDEEGLRTLQQAELAHRGNQAALLAQATTVELSLEVAAELLVEGELSHALAPGDTRLSLTRPAELVIAGVGRMRILPAARDQDRLHAAAQETARALARALEVAGCASLVQAEQAVAERRRVQAALDQAQRGLAECLSGAIAGAAEGRTRPDIVALRQHVAGLQLGVSERLAALGIAAPPDLASALADRLAAATREDQACQEASRARRALLAPDADLGIAEAELREVEFARRDREAECRRLSDEQAAAEAAEPAEALARRSSRAAEAVSLRRLEREALLASGPEGTEDMANAAILRLEQQRSNREARIGSLREEIARLESRIGQEEGIGLDEQIESATRSRDIASRAHDDFRREAAILTLLRDTLLQAERTARERTLAPLMTRMSPYLQALFPRARLSLADDFSITALSRLDSVGPGDADGETFDSLSHGTREQIAILSRLACADMLLASGRPAFLVLDDALAFADQGRMERMFDILTDAGRRMQILVLTCREDVATGLGGTRLRLAS